MRATATSIAMQTITPTAEPTTMPMKLPSPDDDVCFSGSVELPVRQRRQRKCSAMLWSCLMLNNRYACHFMFLRPSKLRVSDATFIRISDSNGPMPHRANLTRLTAAKWIRNVVQEALKTCSKIIFVTKIVVFCSKQLMSNLASSSHCIAHNCLPCCVEAEKRSLYSVQPAVVRPRIYVHKVIA